jgi:hypothetical protein
VRSRCVPSKIGIRTGTCWGCRTNAPDEIKVVIECRLRLLFHHTYDSPNRGVPVIVEERHIVRLFEIHPRELEKHRERVQFVLLRVSRRPGFLPLARKERDPREGASPCIRILHPCPLLGVPQPHHAMGCASGGGRSPEGAGTIRNKDRLRSSALLCLSLHGRALEGPQIGKGCRGNGQAACEGHQWKFDREPR